MVAKPARIRLGQVVNVNDLVLVNGELYVTKIEHFCPLGKIDH